MANSAESVGKKIKELRLDHEMTLEELGNLVGVAKSTVKKWEDGQIANMRRDKIEKLSEIFDVSPADLFGWADYIPADNIFKVERKSFPLLGSIACGEPLPAEENIEVYLQAGSDIKADFCLRAKGDSMINARIYDGDIVFIRKQSMVENGQIAAVLIDNEATLKRMYYDRENNIVQLVAENPSFPPLVYAGEKLNEIRVLGLAVAFQSTLIQ